MKLSEMKRKIAEVEDINSEVNFLERIAVNGIYSINIKPNFSEPVFISTEMTEEFLGKDLMKSIETRINNRKQMRKALLNQLGATDE